MPDEPDETPEDEDDDEPDDDEPDESSAAAELDVVSVGSLVAVLVDSSVAEPLEPLALLEPPESLEPLDESVVVVVDVPLDVPASAAAFDWL